LACGSGRDAVFLSQRKWKVFAIDNNPKLLEKATELGTRYNGPISTLSLDLEDQGPDTLLPIILGHFQVDGFDVIHVARYLHRPLFPLIINLLKPGGVIVYSTFTKGVESFGKPRRPRFILETNELKEVFKSFQIIVHKDAPIEDGRPVQVIVAQK